MNGVIAKIRLLLPIEQKRALATLAGFLVVGIFLEIFGLGILVPILTFILDPEKLGQIVNKISFIDFSLIEYNTIITYSLFFLFIVYLIKTFFLIFITYKQNLILENISAYISVELLKKYLNQSYEKHLKRDVSDIIKNIQIEVIYFQNFCRGLLSLIVEVSLALSILLTILFIEPKGALIIGLLFVILSLTYFQVTKNKLKNWGEIREQIDGRLTRKMIESLSGIKEVKLFNKSEEFVSNYKDDFHKKVKITSNQATLSQIPRFYMELITVFGLVILISLFFYQGKQTSEIVTIIGVFVAAAFRMIPSVNRILSSLQQMKYYSSTVNKIHNEFTKNKEFIKNNSNLEPCLLSQIDIENLSFRYDPEKNFVLDDINLKIKKGETIGIVGESGSGKSSLVDLVNGLLKPSNGVIKIDGQDIQNNLPQWQKNIGYVGQEIFLLDTTIKKNVAFEFDENKIDEPKVRGVIKVAQLESFVNELPLGINTKVGERGIQLSGGQKQRIGIARALYNDPDFLIFDEATASLDDKTEKEVMKSIYTLKGEKTLIIVAHRTSTLSNCDKVYEINNGKIQLKKQEWISMQ